MSNRDLVCLADIVRAARRVRTFTDGIRKEELARDAMRESAVIRQLEIIGEATKRISESFRSTHAEIPWRNMAGMRDLLIHAYDAVDLNEVWFAATAAIPDLLAKLEPLIPPDLRE